MHPSGASLPFASAALASLVGLASARADLPPPPGENRVAYSFRVDAAPRDVVLVAFPLYRSEGGRVVALSPGKDFSPVQGWTPGIYSVPASLASTLVGNDDDEAVRRTLESKGHVCVKRVPRVFAVPTRTKVKSMVDVFRIDASPSGCKASLSKTLYAGVGGEKGEGGADATGRRTPPAPFGNELPPIGDIGVSAAATPSAPTAATAPSAEPAATSTTANGTPATTAPRTSDGAPTARSGCTGCVVATHPDEPGSLLLAAAGWGVLVALVGRRVRVAPRSGSRQS